MQKYFVIPQFLVTEELVKLASEMIDSVRESCPEAFIISVNDLGEYKPAKGWQEALSKSDIVLTNTKNSGFAVTCNNGFRWIFENSGVDNCYIICANNDILINRKTVPELIFPFENFDNVAISGIVSTKEKLWEGKPLEEMNWGSISDGGLLRDRMSDGGLWCSTKEILLNLAEYERKF